MTEEFLHYIWKYRLFDNDITLFSGENIEVISVGEHNTDAGPDFFNAKIKIDNTTWAGNVEIHINASDWNKHGHQSDKAYDNIILHVVYNNDEIIKRKNNEIIPAIELKGKFNDKLFFRYKDFMNNKNWIPCRNLIQSVDMFLINNWLERLLIERLERKAEIIKESLELNNHNWEQTFYQYLACNFGFKLNAEPFELLAKSLPIKCLAKHKNNLFQLEALLFGQAGLLNKKFNDEYPRKLQSEYNFLKKKFSLKSIDSYLWKFLRLRPSNFPTVRIAQFAGLIFKSSGLFSKIIESNNAEKIIRLFNISCSEYWDTHYIFDKPSVKRRKKFGDSAVNLLMINTICPFLFVYGREKDNEIFIDRALKFMEQISGEKNSIITKWEMLGLNVKSAFNTQALLELKNNYCNNKKCLNCRIGNFLLRQA
ncbi:MAG: DUF2851 family protein [Bacteroidales bacterium]|nr:DUF2851 family protein [Bacteroidales bacterium]